MLSAFKIKINNLKDKIKMINSFKKKSKKISEKIMNQSQ